MKADQVKAALLGRWPASECVHIHEAPENSSRQGRRLDVLVVSTWKSRGFALDGVEVKVSMSDWKRELDGYTDARGKEHGGPAKADFWWNLCDRFWIAAPAKVAAKIKPQLPPGWGLLSVADDNKTRVLVNPAVNTEREPIPWPTMVGVLRATAATSTTVLSRAREAGMEAGRREVMDRAGLAADGEADPLVGMRLQELTREVEMLRSTVTDFQTASGVDLSKRWQAGQIGQAVALVLTAMNGGDLDRRFNTVVHELERLLRDFTGQAQTIKNVRAALATIATEDPDPALFGHEG